MNSIKKKILTYLGMSLAFLLAAQAGYVTTMYAGTLKYKNQSQIKKEAITLNINMDVMTDYENGYLRLKFDDKKPVYVTCDPYIDSSCVSKAIDYYNKLFEKINNSYKLELVDEKDIKDKDTHIKIINGNLEIETNYGLHEPELQYKSKKGTFIKDAVITIDWDDLKTLDPISINYVMIHELAHSLGLQDVYVSKGYKYADNTTLMNTENINLIDILFPNDYAMLQAVYSSSYKECKTEEESIKEMKKEIEEYTEYFYNYFSSLIRERKPDIKSLEKNYLDDASFSFERRGYYFDVVVNGNDCHMVIKNGDKQVIGESDGKVHYSNGIFFLSDLEADKHSYIDYAPQDAPYKFNMVIYLDKYDHVTVTDHNGFIPSRLIMNDKNKSR